MKHQKRIDDLMATMGEYSEVLEVLLNDLANGEKDDYSLIKLTVQDMLDTAEEIEQLADEG